MENQAPIQAESRKENIAKPSSLEIAWILAENKTSQNKCQLI